jgi:hypothetical protein
MLLLLALACTPEPALPDADLTTGEDGGGADGGSPDSGGADGGGTEPEPSLPWFRDQDGDGHGDPAVRLWAPQQPEGHVALATDCDDGDPGVFPGAPELCDGVDQDCDGEVDEGLPTFELWPDADGDGFGDPALGEQHCRWLEGWVDNGEDCDDSDPEAWPGAVEDWTDDRDSDCDGEVETAGPVQLSGGVVEQLHLALPAGTATRIVSVRGPASVRLQVDLAQPSRLVLFGQEVAWTVEDLRGSVEETILVEAGAVATTLDDPLFYEQRAAVEAEHGTVASWHGAIGTELLLNELGAWPDPQGWPACESPLDEAPLGPGHSMALPCSGLSDPVCLTVLDQALLALDLDGGRCHLLDLAEPMVGSTLIWSNAHALLREGEHGALSRYDLRDGSRERAWLWPQALLHEGTDALLVPGQPYAGLDPLILYAFESWGDLQCGSGSNRSGVWSEELDVCAVSEGLAWWPEPPTLRAIDLDSAALGGISPPALGELLGLSALSDGSLVLLLEGELRVIDPGTGSTLHSLSLERAGRGLACTGG